MSTNLTSTPYDDVFRTLLNDCRSLIIPLINEIFGEHYSGTEEIIFAPNEHFINRQDGIEEERITDTSFQILGDTPKKYHLECQSNADNSMLIRFLNMTRKSPWTKGKSTAISLPLHCPILPYCFCGTLQPPRNS